MRGLLAFLALCFATSTLAREWTDVSGRVTQEGDLVDFDDRLVIIKKDSGRLVAVEIEDLSKTDRDYLDSREAKDLVAKAASPDRSWTLANGEKVTGRVVEYGIKEVVLSRRNSKLFVNGKPYSELTDLQQTVIPKIVAEFEKKPIADAEEIESLIVANKGKDLVYTVEGVLLEGENGEVFGVPFFLFSSKDLAVLKPGWDEWLAAQKDEQRQQQESMLLRSLANEHQRDRKISHQIQMLHYASQWFDLWEVDLIAPNGLATSVVVPARNSLQAQYTAQNMYPQLAIGAARRVPRRY